MSQKLYQFVSTPINFYFSYVSSMSFKVTICKQICVAITITLNLELFNIYMYYITLTYLISIILITSAYMCKLIVCYHNGNTFVLLELKLPMT